MTLLYKLKLSKQLGLVLLLPALVILTIIGIYGLRLGTEFVLVISLLLCAYLIIMSSSREEETSSMLNAFRQENSTEN